MPHLLLFNKHEEKSRYLKDLFSKTYISNVIERNKISDEVLEDLLNIISSSVGLLTNPTKLSNTFKSVKQVSISNTTNFLSPKLYSFGDRSDLIENNNYEYISKGSYKVCLSRERNLF